LSFRSGANLDQVFYTYNSAGEASSFLISAVISLGDLSLDLSYQYVSSEHGAAPTATDLSKLFIYLFHILRILSAKDFIFVALSYST